MKILNPVFRSSAPQTPSVENDETRKYYERAALRGGWTVITLGSPNRIPRSFE